jgi:hypothetical protein
MLPILELLALSVCSGTGRLMCGHPEVQSLLDKLFPGCTFP